MVLRLVEWHGRATDVRVALPCAGRRVRRVNLLAEAGEAVPVTGREARPSLRAFGIATLMVECQP